MKLVYSIPTIPSGTVLWTLRHDYLMHFLAFHIQSSVLSYLKAVMCGNWTSLHFTLGVTPAHTAGVISVWLVLAKKINEWRAIPPDPVSGAETTLNYLITYLLKEKSKSKR